MTIILDYRIDTSLRLAIRFFLMACLFLSMEIRVHAQELPDTISYRLPGTTTTGTRISTPWLDVPLALSVVSPSDMSIQKGYGLEEALSGIPGVMVFSRSGNQDIRLTIRGFGARGAGERSNSGTSRGIRILVDGFPETEPDGRTSFDLVDIASARSIEVVRSNASSVWGNAAGGVVNIRSNVNFQQPYAHSAASYGSFGFHKEVLQVGARLGQGKFLLSMSNTNADGWRRHSQSSLSLVQLSLASPLGDQTALEVYLTGGSNLFRIPGPLTQTEYEEDPRQANADFLSRDERRYNRLARVGVRVSHTFSDEHSITASAFLNPKLLQRSERNTFRDFTRLHLGGNIQYRWVETITHDMQSVFLAGVDEAFQDGSILFYSLRPDGGRGSSLVQNKREGANNLGIFVSEELSFGPRWTVSGGARYDAITYHSQSFMGSLLSDSRSFWHITPKVGITYKPSPVQSIYASIGGGVEVPAGNETDPVPGDTIHALNVLLEPVTSTTIEVGYKYFMEFGLGDWAGVLTLDAALYTLTVSNDIIPYRNGRFYLTAGRTRRSGAELGARMAMEEGLSIRMSMTFSDNLYKEYAVDSSLYDPLKSGIATDFSGNTVAGVPSFFYSTAVRYTAMIPGHPFIEASVQGVGEYFADDRNMIRVPARRTVNATIGFEKIRLGLGKFFATGYAGVQNMFNEVSIGSAWINPGLDNQGDPIYIEPGQPRSWVLSLQIGTTL